MSDLSNNIVLVWMEKAVFFLTCVQISIPGCGHGGSTAPWNLILIDRFDHWTGPFSISFLTTGLSNHLILKHIIRGTQSAHNPHLCPILQSSSSTTNNQRQAAAVLQEQVKRTSPLYSPWIFLVFVSVLCWLTPLINHFISSTSLPTGRWFDGATDHGEWSNQQSTTSRGSAAGAGNSIMNTQ